MVRPKQHSAKRRRKRERVDRRQEHGDRNRDRELAKQLTADPGDKSHRYEHREKDERDGENWPGDLGHGLLAGFLHGQVRVLLHHPFDVLDDDNGVIDDNADGKNQREK